MALRDARGLKSISVINRQFYHIRKKMSPAIRAVIIYVRHIAKGPVPFIFTISLFPGQT